MKTPDDGIGIVGPAEVFAATEGVEVVPVILNHRTEDAEGTIAYL